jgi:hypothetical protein
VVVEKQMQYFDDVLLKVERTSRVQTDNVAFGQDPVDSGFLRHDSWAVKDIGV